MKKSQLKELIKEEIRKVLKESLTVNPTLLDRLQKALKARQYDEDDINALDKLEAVITDIIKTKGMSNNEAKSLAKDIINDENTLYITWSELLKAIDAAYEEKANEHGALTPINFNSGGVSNTARVLFNDKDYIRITNPSKVQVGTNVLGIYNGYFAEVTKIITNPTNGKLTYVITYDGDGERRQMSTKKLQDLFLMQR
jgi:hypothetical protein